MTASRREQALQALADLIGGIAWGASPAPTVERNAPEIEELPAGGLISIRDGDPGEPEMDLSPPAYQWSHRAEVVVMVQRRDAASRDALLDGLLLDIGAALIVNDTLGGAVDYVHPGAAAPDLEREDGAPTVKAMLLPVILEYVTETPLG